MASASVFADLSKRTVTGINDGSSAVQITNGSEIKRTSHSAAKSPPGTRKLGLNGKKTVPMTEAGYKYYLKKFNELRGQESGGNISANTREDAFFSDRLLKNELKDYVLKNPRKARRAGLSASITKNDLKEARIGQCLGYRDYNQYPSTNVKNWCIGNAFVSANPQSSTRNFSTFQYPQCKYNGRVCKATTGRDLLDLPVIPGWYLIENHVKRMVIYEKPRVEKVNVRGKTNRYLSQEYVTRIYQDPIAGTAPTTSTFGSYDSSCYDTGYGMNCTTTTPTQITTPGTSARPGGVIQRHRHAIYDCDEGTVGSHLNQKLQGKWKSVSASQRKNILDKYCPFINSLTLSSFSTYAK